ncbi:MULTISPECIES: DedA family protein [Pseudomonas]|uniref:DedA family protein n=1 Tax=Pseudomonas TaxID=286 RepID=UPI00123B8704|nr:MULTISPECIES: DedA family protein [Pseudomonas]QIB52908.1 DedA family protein [Pseudomonas sp. OIL-1]
MAWLSTHSQWLGFAIFLIALVESLAIAGLLVPGVVLMFAATAMAGGGDLRVWATLAWAFSGAVVGDLLSFALGRVFHQDIRRLSLFRRHPQWIDRGERFFRHYGVLSILIGRFVGPIRPVIPMVAGMFDMPVWRFVLVNIVSALAWAPAYVLPGFYAGRALRWPVPEYFWAQALGLLAALAALGLVLLTLLRIQERWSPFAAGALTLFSVPLLYFTRPWFGIAEVTASTWLEGYAASAEPLAFFIGTLISPVYAALLAVLIVLSMLLLRQWRQLAYSSLSIVICITFAWLPGLTYEGMILSNALALSMVITVICNREQSFWHRTAWMIYLIPLCLLLIGSALISLATPPLVALSALLLAVAATLFSLWLVDRGATMGAPRLPLKYLLPLVPLAAVVLMTATPL